MDYLSALLDVGPIVLLMAIAFALAYHDWKVAGPAIKHSLDETAYHIENMQREWETMIDNARFRKKLDERMAALGLDPSDPATFDPLASYVGNYARWSARTRLQRCVYCGQHTTGKTGVITWVCPHCGGNPDQEGVI